MKYPLVTNQKLIDILNLLPEDYPLLWVFSGREYAVKELKTWALILNDNENIYETEVSANNFFITAYGISIMFKGEVVRDMS